jgi:hypothetical protein
MTTDDRIAALEATVAMLLADTHETRHARESVNAERAWIAAQQAKPQYDPQERERQRLLQEQAEVRTWRDYLTKKQREQQAALDAMGLEQHHRGDLVWGRRREDIELTLKQIEHGVSLEPGGDLYAITERDGIDRNTLERRGGLRRAERRAKEIDEQLTALV